MCNFQLPPVGPISCDKNGSVYILSFTYRAIPPHSSGAAPALSRHSGAGSLCGTATEDSVTNGNYICVFFMNPSNTGLLKMLPRYLKLSATSNWDQIGMLLRQSRTTHPLVSPVMCVTVCVGEYHVLFNYKCTLSTVVDVLEIGWLQVQFEVYVCVCGSSYSSQTWRFNATCQAVCIQLSQDIYSSLQACGNCTTHSLTHMIFLNLVGVVISNFDVGCVSCCVIQCSSNGPELWGWGFINEPGTYWHKSLDFLNV